MTIPDRRFAEGQPTGRELPEGRFLGRGPAPRPASRRRSLRLVAGLSLVAGSGLLALMALPGAASVPRLPARSGPRLESRFDELSATLAELRAAVDSYWTRHDGFPGPTAEDVAAQLLGHTDAHGTVGLGLEQDLGPFLPPARVALGRLPLNPLNGRDDVQVVEALPAAPDGTTGWIYCRLTGEWRANVGGERPDGTPLFGL